MDGRSVKTTLGVSVMSLGTQHTGFDFFDS